MKYKSSKNNDGSFNVLEVPIFQLGTHKGFSYTKKWAEETLKTHKALEKNEYFPSVIIGHTDNKGEKPAVAFLKNLKLKGDFFFADLIKISSNFFDKLKERAYPYRSVEVSPVKNRFAVLGLLGGTPPYFKLPIMEVYKDYFHDDDEHVVIEFDADALDWDKSIEEQAKDEERRSKFRRIIDTFTGRLWNIMRSDKDIKELSTITQEVLEDGSTAIIKELKTKKIKNKEEIVYPKTFTEEQLLEAQNTASKEGGTKFREDFKKSHGMYPEDLVKTRDDEKEKVRLNGIKLFCDELKTKDRGEGKILAPVIVDEFVQPFLEGSEDGKFKFGENEVNENEAAQTIVTKILEFAASDRLFVAMDEKSLHADSTEIKTHFDSDEDVDPEALAYHKKALKYMEDHEGVSYEDAVNKVISK